MKAQNLADLEHQLLAAAWTVHAQDFVAPHDIPGQVQTGGYTVMLEAPTGERFTGDGATRSDALRQAVELAGLIEPNEPHLL
ncbi:MAG: hypothetical protein JWN95_113 [Frankiales bacterium]|nr:hypothetical protein [Frankiales bacterium]